MKVFKSKKGIGTSVIADVFALLAYFVFFIVVIILITLPTEDMSSKAKIDTLELESDYQMRLLSNLRTTIEVDNRNISFADYLSGLADAEECEPGSSINSDLLEKYEKEFRDAIKQLGDPMFSMENADSCGVWISFEGVTGNCPVHKQTIGWYNSEQACTIPTSERVEVTFPTRKKNIVKIGIKFGEDSMKYYPTSGSRPSFR